MYYIQFFLGAVIAIFILSIIIRGIFLRKIGEPKKQLVSLGAAYILSIILAGYGMADGGDPKLLDAAVNYGIATIILLVVEMAIYHGKSKNS